MRKRKILYGVLLLVVWLAAPLFLTEPGVSANPLRRTIFALPADGDVSAVLVDDGRQADLEQPAEVLNGLKYWFYILNPDVLIPKGGWDRGVRVRVEKEGSVNVCTDNYINVGYLIFYGNMKNLTAQFDAHWPEG